MAMDRITIVSNVLMVEDISKNRVNAIKGSGPTTSGSLESPSMGFWSLNLLSGRVRPKQKILDGHWIFAAVLNPDKRAKAAIC